MCGRVHARTHSLACCCTTTPHYITITTTHTHTHIHTTPPQHHYYTLHMAPHHTPHMCKRTLLPFLQVDIPDWWSIAVSSGDMVLSRTLPLDGYMPSFSNGFIGGDSGCSSYTQDALSSTKAGSCGRVYLAGVFNNQSYYGVHSSSTPFAHVLLLVSCATLRHKLYTIPCTKCNESHTTHYTPRAPRGSLLLL